MRTRTGKLRGCPALRDFASLYLPLGIAKCAVCTRDFKTERRRIYGCVFHRNRGPSICRNNLFIRQDTLEVAVRKAADGARGAGASAGIAGRSASRTWRR